MKLRITQVTRDPETLREPCTACSGTGYYDNTGSPACSACDGTGKSRA